MSQSTREEHAQLLRRQVLFAKLGDAEIAELLTRARIQRHAAGTEIFAKGSPGESMMAVLHGSVKITSPSSDGREVVLNIIDAGEFFGEIALLDGGERSGYATALTDCELLIFYRRDFLPFLQRHPDVFVQLIEVLCQRLRNTSELVEDVAFVTLGSRVAKTLLRLVEHERAATKPVVLHVTQRELGNMVGGARESVNRQLQAWQKAGLIELGKGTIAIRDLTGLHRLVA
jgi:CRP/FNR family transcriptional regulator, cyclic AMP receptor protein